MSIQKSKIYTELEKAETNQEIHRLLKICDSLYRNIEIEEYTINDLPPDEIYEHYVNFSCYPSTVIIQNLDKRTRITTSPKIMDFNQILNSFIFNRYYSNPQQVKAIVYMLTKSKFETEEELSNLNGAIKANFREFIDKCKNWLSHSPTNPNLKLYLYKLGINADIIDDLTKMFELIKITENDDSIATYINTKGVKEGIKNITNLID